MLKSGQVYFFTFNRDFLMLKEKHNIINTKYTIFKIQFRRTKELRTIPNKIIMSKISF